MNYFFINSDADSFNGPHDLNKWFRHGLAFTGGEKKFGEQLAKLNPDDVCLIYENRIGIVGVGRVLEIWDQASYEDPIYYVGHDGLSRDGINESEFEYRIRVDWLQDLRAEPISLTNSNIGYVPRGAVSRIVNWQSQIENLVAVRELAESFPEEIGDTQKVLTEGAKKTICVNAYERSAIARQQCIRKWGFRCSVCDLSMQDIYGRFGDKLIHVHHLIPLSEIKAEYVIDPINDMLPVCPNCHAILHRRAPPYSVQEIRDAIREAANNRLNTEFA